MNAIKALGIGVLLAVALGLAACERPAATEDAYEVVLFVGSLSGQNAIERRQGILDELEGKPAPEPPAAVSAPVQLPPLKLAPGEKPRVALVSNASAEFWTIARAGFNKGLAETGAEGDFRTPDGTVAQQKTFLEDLLSKRMHGIAVSPIDADNQTPDLNKIAEKAILICQDSDAPKSQRVLYIGTNNYRAGREAGKLIREALGDDKPIRVIDTRTDNTDRARAKANVEDLLASRPDIDCLVGLWSYNGPAIADVLRSRNLAGKIKAVSFDEERPTLQAIREGVIHGTVVQKPFEFGYQSVKILTALIGGDTSVVPPNRVIDTGVTLVKKENVDEFEQWLDGVLKSQ